MRRSRRARGQDFYEDEQLLTEETEAYDAYDEMDAEYEDLYDDEEYEDEKSGVGKKIITAIIIVLALIALFFASTKITEILLDYNQEPTNFAEEEAPNLYEDDEEYEDAPLFSFEPETATPSPTATNKPSEFIGGGGEVTTPKPSTAAKPSASATASPSVKPSAAPSASAPATTAPTQKPTEAPKTQKPVIIPGNPAN